MQGSRFPLLVQPWFFFFHKLKWYSYCFSSCAYRRHTTFSPDWSATPPLLCPVSTRQYAHYLWRIWLHVRTLDHGEKKCSEMLHLVHNLCPIFKKTWFRCFCSSFGFFFLEAEHSGRQMTAVLNIAKMLWFFFTKFLLA